MNFAKFVKNGFENTCFTVTNKASNTAMSVSLFVSFHKLRCLMIYNSSLSYYFFVCKGVNSFGKQKRNYAVYSKTAIKANRVDK